MGGGVGRFLNPVKTLNDITGRTAQKAQKEAIEAQTRAMEKASQQQAEAQRKAYELQERAQAQTDQANEKAQKASASLTRESADRGNSADLTSGLAMRTNTRNATLGNGQNLGIEDEEDWF